MVEGLQKRTTVDKNLESIYSEYSIPKNEDEIENLARLEQD